jgi:starch-binding outer membrane protein, SusD/RagB family
MKSFKQIILMCFVVFVLTSCHDDVLNKEPVDIITESAVWSSIELVDAQVINLYARTDFNNVFDQQGKLVNITDEARTCFGWSRVLNVFSLGVITPDNIFSGSTNVGEGRGVRQIPFKLHF